MRQLNVKSVTWPAQGVFRISRSSLSVFDCVQVEIQEENHVGRGECRPYARYGESIDSVSEQIEIIRSDIETGIDNESLQSLIPPGAARNAVDCALWDLAAKRSGRPVWDLLDLPPPRPRITAYTLSIDTPDAMAQAARKARDYPVLKMKTGQGEVLDSIAAVLAARPDAKLIIDANEAMSPDILSELQIRFARAPILMIEQPLRADRDHIHDPSGIPVCADEALHVTEDLDRLWAQGYRAVNVKLDKCGGPTEGVRLMQAAKAKGFIIMAGCMVSSSLAMAPMMMLENYADVIDLDGPLLLAEDIEHGLDYDGPTVHPPTPALWG